MASDAAMRAMDSTNPCCAVWKKSYTDMCGKRNALRQGVGILKGQIDRLQQENLNLKKACDEERTRANVMDEEKRKEASLRISMEKEIAAFKSEISSKCEIVSGNEDLNKEVTLLRTCLSERQVEIDHLKRLLTEEGRRADAEKDHADTERKRLAELQQALAYEKSRAEEARKKAAALENEIAALKSEILTSGPAVVSGTEDLNKEVTLLQACISERELEIDRLKQLLIEEERKAGAVRQRADSERGKTVELQEALAYEKCRAEEARKTADDLGKKDEENRVQLETLKNEVDKMRLKCEEAKKKLEAEKKKVICEKKRADEEKARVIEQRRIAEANEKKVVEEKSHANNLLIQLEEKQQNVNKLQKELQEVMSSHRSAYFSELDEVKMNLEAEMKKYATEKERADTETSKRVVQEKVAEASTKKAIEEKHRADKLSQDLKSSRQRVEYLEKQLHEVKNMLEAERKKALWEEKRADAEKLKSDEQERIAAENGRLVTEEKSRANNLCLELENNRKKLQDIENELRELKSPGKRGEASDIPALVVNEQASELQFLQKQLKFEKQRVKHAKEVAELEKDRNIMIQQELFRVRQGVECFLHQLDVLTDIGARNGVNDVSKKSSLSDVHTGILSKRMLPSLMYPCGDAGFRMSSLSSGDASCQLKENRGFMPAGHHLESPSASFSDEQLVGSQERVAGSLTTSAVLAAEKSNLEATILKCSNECHKWKDGEKVGTSPVKTTVHATKRRKIVDELESIKFMQSEGKRIFDEAEKKLSALHSTFIHPVIELTEKENCLSPVCVVNSCSNHDQSSKKRKASHEPEATCLHTDDSSVQAEVGKHEVALTVSKKLESSVVLQDHSKKRKAPHEPEATCLHIDDSSVQAELGKHEIALSASERLENSVVLQDASRDTVKCHQEDLSFEELMNGDYMKLLNLDNDVDEECFRTAMESPLSPTLPEINFRDNEPRIDTQMLSVCTSNSHEAGDQHGGFMHEGKIQLYCIVFSDMKGDSTINRIFGAVRTCLTQCCLFLDTKWLVHDILAALGLEKDLTPREKVCALFSLILLNFSGVSSRKCEDYQNKKLLDSFRAHINSVLSVMETRSLFEEICHISDLVSLFEDFVLRRRILLQSNAASETRHDSSSSFEIVNEGNKYVLSQKLASIDLIMAGSITLASICTAIGHTGSICEVSFNIVRMCGTYQMTLRILHMFAYLCGQEYVSNSCTFMRVVKSVIIFVENNLASIAGVDLQLGSDGEPCFIPCAQCPFSEGLFSLDDVSAMLLEELQNYCLGPPSVTQVAAGQVHLSTTEPVLCNLGDVLSSLELISSKMGWTWACNKIVPKLLKMLELCDRGRVSSTALVALLGELGRLGVKEDGYGDRVETIKCKLGDILCHVDTTKCNAFAMAVVSALVGLHPEEFVNINVKLPSGHFASSSMRNCLSWLSSEQITSLFGLENPPLIV